MTNSNSTARGLTAADFLRLIGSARNKGLRICFSIVLSQSQFPQLPPPPRLLLIQPKRPKQDVHMYCAETASKHNFWKSSSSSAEHRSRRGASERCGRGSGAFPLSATTPSTHRSSFRQTNFHRPVTLTTHCARYAASRSSETGWSERATFTSADHHSPASQTTSGRGKAVEAPRPEAAIWGKLAEVRRHAKSVIR